MPILSFPRDPWPALPPLPPEEIAEGTADQTGVCLHDTGESFIGVWGCSPWVATAGPYSCDEFMLLLSGSVTLVVDGATHTFRAGDAFVIPKGLDCQWVQKEPVTKVYAIFTSGTAVPGARALRVDPAMQLSPASPPASTFLTGPAPDQSSAQIYADGSRRFSVGVWASTPYSRRPIPYPRSEIMHLTQGTVTLTEAGRPPVTFSAGDTFLVTEGTVVDWQSNKDVQKIYCSILPRSPA